MSYSPALLPAITAVDVFVLTMVHMADIGAFIENPANRVTTRLSEEDAETVAALWRQLPPGEPDRCHNPPYGLRFWSEDTVLCRASLCWGCNNIKGNAGGERVYYPFDSFAGVSRELLALLDKSAGIVR